MSQFLKKYQAQGYPIVHAFFQKMAIKSPPTLLHFPIHLNVIIMLKV